VKRGQVLILALAAAAIGLMAVLAGGGNGNDSGGGGGQGTGSAPAKPPSGSVVVDFPYSPEKEALLTPLVKAFNASGAQVDGKRVFVQARSESSGETEAAIVKGTAKPAAWSPASSLWGRLLNYEADRPYVAADNPSLVRTPLVIAMWEPMARALGWPKKELGWADILRLARSKAGWADYGHPEYGSFKLVHTNPDFSTAGLSSVVAEYYSATGKREGLLEADIPKARPQVKAIEGSIVHYGDTTIFIKQQLRREGPSYASAVAMEETTLLEFNRDRGPQPKLVAIYPREGTFYSDDPFIVLDAPWVTPQQKQGAAAFRDFLARRLTPETVARSGFRPGDPNAAPVAPLDAAHGVDPAQPTRLLGLPDPGVVAALKRAWREDRKPANVLLVLDTSGSMNSELRLENAKSGLIAFLHEVAPQDRVGLLGFSDKVAPLVPIEPMATNRAKLIGVVHGVLADGQTAIYDATHTALEQVRRIADSSRINAIVLLTDGEDNSSELPFDALLRELRAQGEGDRQVRVFTIAYSAGASGAAAALQRISDESGGKAYTGHVDNIATVYRSISSFF
jgi:Ca-activated chloride channel family protein